MEESDVTEVMMLRCGGEGRRRGSELRKAGQGRAGQDRTERIL